MWLADDDVIQAEALERETLLTYWHTLNTKIVKVTAIKNKRPKNMKGG